MSKNLMDNLISFNELVENGLFKKGTLYWLTSKRAIPFYRIGRRIFFDESELNEWLKTRKVEAVEE